MTLFVLSSMMTTMHFRQRRGGALIRIRRKSGGEKANAELQPVPYINTSKIGVDPVGNVE